MKAGAWLGLRLAMALVCALVLARHFGELLLQAGLPALRASLAVAAPDFRVVDMGLVRERGTLSVGVVAVQARTVWVDGRAVVPDETPGMLLAMSTAGTFWQPLLAALVVALAWPVQRWRELPGRLLVLPLLAAPALALDAPLAIASSLWAGFAQGQGSTHTGLLAAWTTFLNGGGRLLLGVAAGALTVAAGRRPGRRA